MLAAYLQPYPARGYAAPFLWIYYRLLTVFPEPVTCLTSADYLVSSERWQTQGRWEVTPAAQDRLGYRVPDHAAMAEATPWAIDQSLFDPLTRAEYGNDVAVYRRLLTEPLPALVDELKVGLTRVDHLEAVLTWCNCPSLTIAAGALGVPVVHLELGPLRGPEYRPTAYLDFSGVNGGTEAERRYRASGFSLGPGTGLGHEGVLARLRSFFRLGAEDQIAGVNQEYSLGLALQVEDDSNLIAFGHGFDNQSLLVYALAQAGKSRSEARTLVRAHPGSLFSPRPAWYTVDDSADSPSFIARCSAIMTINSSVGFEAMLMGKPVTLLGESSFAFVAGAESPEEFLNRMVFYLFAYLVPMHLIDDPEYLRFRLGRPSEAAIMLRHLSAYGCPVNPSETTSWNGVLGVLQREILHG